MRASDSHPFVRKCEIGDYEGFACIMTDRLFFLNVTGSDRNNIVYATIVARAWEDEAFKRRLLDDPTAVCREEGMAFPEDMIIDLREDTPDSTHVVLPSEDWDQGIAQLGELIKASLPLPPNHALILLQNQATLSHLVLPVNPRDVNVDLTDADLEALAAGGYTAVNSNVVANHQVAANAVAVANGFVASHVGVAAMAVCVLVLYPFSCSLFELIPSRVSLKTRFSSAAS